MRVVLHFACEASSWRLPSIFTLKRCGRVYPLALILKVNEGTLGFLMDFLVRSKLFLVLSPYPHHRYVELLMDARRSCCALTAMNVMLCGDSPRPHTRHFFDSKGTILWTSIMRRPGTSISEKRAGGTICPCI